MRTIRLFSTLTVDGFDVADWLEHRSLNSDAKRNEPYEGHFIS